MFINIYLLIPRLLEQLSHDRCLSFNSELNESWQLTDKHNKCGEQAHHY